MSDEIVSATARPHTIAYVPPYSALSKCVQFDREKRTATIPLSLFRLLLKLVFAGAGFDANWYRKANPDVEASIRTRSIVDEMSHFLLAGYEEGRRFREFEVDESWYRATYQDVDVAIRAGRMKSASEHFKAAGYAEGRYNNAEAARFGREWEEALRSASPSPKSG